MRITGTQPESGSSIDGRRWSLRLDGVFRRAAIGLLLLLVTASAAESPDPIADPDAAEVLSRAFQNRYGVDTVQRIQLTVRNDAGSERRHLVEIATKRIDHRLHSLGRFLAPPDLRGTSILIIENRDRSDDHFIFFPYLEKVRRIGSAQRADAFMGTDLTYEDFERRYVEDYRIIAAELATLGDEDVALISVSPVYDSGYALAEFAVSTADFAILRVRYFKRNDAAEPSKVMLAPRDRMSRIKGHTLPTWMEVSDLRRRTTTVVRMERIDVDPELPDELFSAVSLRLRKPIPFAEPGGTVGPDAD